MKRIISAADRGGGLIGIWWYTEDHKIIGLSEPVNDGIFDGRYIQYSSGNHMTRWRDVVSKYIQYDQESVIVRGHKSLYRGRVIYDTMTCCYVVIYSEDLKNDREFRKEIVEYFQLFQCNREFQCKYPMSETDVGTRYCGAEKKDE